MSDEATAGVLRMAEEMGVEVFRDGDHVGFTATAEQMREWLGGNPLRRPLAGLETECRERGHDLKAFDGDSRQCGRCARVFPGRCSKKVRRRLGRRIRRGREF